MILAGAAERGEDVARAPAAAQTTMRLLMLLAREGDADGAMISRRAYRSELAAMLRLSPRASTMAPLSVIERQRGLRRFCCRALRAGESFSRHAGPMSLKCIITCFQPYMRRGVRAVDGRCSDAATRCAIGHDALGEPSRLLAKDILRVASGAVSIGARHRATSFLAMPRQPLIAPPDASSIFTGRAKYRGLTTILRNRRMIG